MVLKFLGKKFNGRGLKFPGGVAEQALASEAHVYF